VGAADYALAAAPGSPLARGRRGRPAGGALNVPARGSGGRIVLLTHGGVLACDREALGGASASGLANGAGAPGRTHVGVLA